MASLDHDEKTVNVDCRLDITGETCPLTFVRTKLLLERMQSGQVAEIRLQGTEPLDNVPKSVRDHGHTVLSLAPESAGSPIHLMLVRRN